MSAEVPPISSVMTFSKPAMRPAQIPPINPATGPDMSSETGRASAERVPTVPPDDCMSWTSLRNPASPIALSKRST
jgi:hypothetical protein